MREARDYAQNRVEWEDVTSCNYCGGTDFSTYLVSSRPPWFDGQDMQLLRCGRCNLVFASPRPRRERIYTDMLDGGPIAEATFERKAARRNVDMIHSRHLSHAMSFIPEAKRVFDMGFGAGTIMQAARTLGLEASGNEINRFSCEALARDGFEVHHGFTRDLDLPAEHFDIVVNFDYLEHSYEPYEDLLTCNRILRDQGILHLKTLYLDCPDHILKGDAYQLFGAGHFAYFFPRTLCSMLYSAGFTIEELRLGALIFVVARKAREPEAEPVLRFDDPAVGLPSI